MNKQNIIYSQGGITITLFNKWVIILFAKKITVAKLMEKPKWNNLK
jgi:hypothetical protein